MEFKSTKGIQNYFELFGFKRYKDNFYSADFMMQKCIYDDTTNDKKYYIEVYIYDNRKYGNGILTYESKVQFHLEDDSVVNITLFGRNHLNDEIHEFFEKFYSNFNCIPYERS